MRRFMICALSAWLLFDGRRAVADELIRATRVATGLSRPVYVTSPPNDNQRLFIPEQHSGRIQILDRQTGQILPTPFLDLSGLSTGNEQGLLGLAFDPNYATTGRFFVNYTESNGATNIVGYQVSSTDPNRADPSTAQTILRFTQPQANHNGGWMGFGPRDGFLYVGSGDGGAGDDSGPGHTSGTGNAQDVTNNLLGKMLRVDITGDDFPDDARRNYRIPASNPFVGKDGDDEIWSYGLRNPWRNSFDRQTGDLYIGDVGQGAREEIDFQPAASLGGENYGWRLREGFIQTPNVGGARPAGAIDPIHDYPHQDGPNGGFSVTGGYVYRGPISALQGHYFFSDYVSGQLWSLRYDGQTVSDFQNRTMRMLTDAGSITEVSSFGEDPAGNLYVVSLAGDVFRFDEVLSTATLVDEGAVWQFLDDGSDQQSAWRAPEFNSDSWKSGPAELGYGDGDEATPVDFGGVPTNRHVTTYFRHKFQVDDPTQYDQLVVELLRDDGGAVYLNGTELVRTDNLAPNADFQSLANFNGAPAINGSNEDLFLTSFVPASQLRAGENVLAVEMHQHSLSSNDLSFNLRLSAVLNPAAVPGDFDGNGLLDANDIDQLTRAIQMGQTDSRWDINGDTRVDGDDRLTWVHDLKRTWFGDSDLNGLFDEADLVRALQAGQYEDTVPANSLWESGDFDGDLEFTTSDLIAAFVDGGYLAGPRAAAAVVPESGIAYGLPWAMAILAIVRRYEKAARSSFKLRGMAVANSSLPSNSSEMNPR